MRVLALGWEWPPKLKGGLGRHTYFLSRELAKLGHEIVFAAPRQNLPKMSGLSGVKLLPVELMAERNYLDQVDAILRKYPGAVEKAVEGDFDVIHGHDWMAVEPALRLRRKLRIPFVFTLHSSERDRSGTTSKKSRVAWVEMKGTAKADVVLTVSRFMKRQIQGWEVKRKIRVVPNGVEARKGKFKPSKLVLYVGRLTEQKGVEYFLLAAAEIQKKASAEFIVAGEGHLRKPLERFAKIVGVKARFPRFVTEKELERLYARAGVVVVPSVFEPFGIVPLEALAHGKPLVLSKTAGVAEFLEDGRNALLVSERKPKEIAAAVLRILKNRRLARKLAREGAAVAEKFEWQKVAEATEGAYLEATKSRKNSRV